MGSLYPGTRLLELTEHISTFGSGPSLGLDIGLERLRKVVSNYKVALANIQPLLNHTSGYQQVYPNKPLLNSQSETV